MQDLFNALQRVRQPAQSGTFAITNYFYCDGPSLVELVLSSPLQFGPPLRMPIEGEYDAPELAEVAALDVFATMTRRP